jgi:hypothetical protein
MQEERRKFLWALLVGGGGAVALPELVEAAQQTLKVERPFVSANVTHKHEEHIDENTVDRHSQMVVVGANDVKHVETMSMTTHEAATHRRTYVASHVALYQHSTDEQPTHTYVTSATITVRPIAGTKQSEVTIRGISPKGAQAEKKLTVETPSKRVGGDINTEEQMVDAFLRKVREGGKQ